MRCRKTAIAVPAPILAAVDKAAHERGESRSRYISRILDAAVRARRDAEITARLNALFADESLRAEQSRTASDLDAVGSSWADERW